MAVEMKSSAQLETNAQDIVFELRRGNAEIDDFRRG